MGETNEWLINTFIGLTGFSIYVGYKIFKWVVKSAVREAMSSNEEYEDVEIKEI